MEQGVDELPHRYLPHAMAAHLNSVLETPAVFCVLEKGIDGLH